MSQHIYEPTHVERSEVMNHLLFPFSKKRANNEQYMN
jgi:hypothetical protein